MPEIPVVLLGVGAVGKSTLTIQYIQGQFVEKYDATIEDVYRKTVEIDSESCVLMIVDTAGQDAFASMREGYMKTGQGFILVYSITDAESLQGIKKMYAQLRRLRGDGEALPCLVVANKADLSADRQVSSEEGQLFARQVGASFLELTARDHSAVDGMFASLVRLIRGGGTLPTAGSPAPATVPTAAAAAQPRDTKDDTRAASTAPPEQVSKPAAAAPAPGGKKPPNKRRWWEKCVLS